MYSENKYLLTSDGELYHWGVKGQKWGVRRYQNKDGSLTPAGQKKYNKKKKLVDDEINFQKKKIAEYESRAKAFRDSAKEVRTKGFAELKKHDPTLSDKTAREAVDVVAKRRENEARWNEHVAKHLKTYNEKLSRFDIKNVEIGRLKVAMYIQQLGEETRNAINSTWVENV